jgi:hypothetical protein
MRTDFKAFVGLDVHKDSIAIAYADADFGQAPRFLGTTGYSVISLTKALATLGEPKELSLCHEAGPCGYGLVRSLRKRGYATEVIAPSRTGRPLGRRQTIGVYRGRGLPRASRETREAALTPRPEGTATLGSSTHCTRSERILPVVWQQDQRARQQLVVLRRRPRLHADLRGLAWPRQQPRTRVGSRAAQEA